jgi:hypothetical protein
MELSGFNATGNATSILMFVRRRGEPIGKVRYRTRELLQPLTVPVLIEVFCATTGTLCRLALTLALLLALPLVLDFALPNDF